MRTIILIAINLLLIADSYCQAWKQYADSAKTFRENKKLDKAITYYLKANQLIPLDSSLTDTFIALNKNLGELYIAKSQYAQAQPYFTINKEILEKNQGKENTAFVTNLNLLGMAYYLDGKYKEAENYYKEVKDISEKLYTRQSAEYAKSCNSLAAVYQAIGRNDKALQLHTEAKQIRKALFTEENADYAQSCNNLSVLYLGMGQYEKAELLGLEAKEIRGRVTGKDSPVYANSCINLANIYRDMGQYQKAEALYLEGKAVREAAFTKEHAVYAESCNILADLYNYMHRYDTAEALYLEAKDIRERLFKKQSYPYAQSLNNLASLYSNMGNFDKAEPLALEAKQIYETVLPANHPTLAISYNNLGTLYFLMGKYKEATTYFRNARNRWKKDLGEQHPYFTDNSASLAKVYWNEKELKKADDLYVQAFTEQYRQVNKIFAFTNETEKAAYLKIIKNLGDEYQSFSYAHPNTITNGHAYALALLNRNLILSSARQLRQIVYNTRDSLLTSKYNEWISLKQQLSGLYSKGGGINQEQTTAVEEKADILEKELSRASGEFRRRQENQQPGWSKIQANLKNDEAAIEFTSFRFYDGRRWTDSSFYIALLLRKDQPGPVLVRLFEERQLEDLFTTNLTPNSFYRGTEITNKSVNASSSLYKIAWKPLEKYLLGVKRIYFAPSGLLHKVAFAALPFSPNKSLIDKYQLVQLNSTGSIPGQANPTITKKDKTFLYGGIFYDTDSSTIKEAAKKYRVEQDPSLSLSLPVNRGDQWSFLEGTKTEIEGIKQLLHYRKFTVSVFEGSAATEESVKALDGTDSPSVLHLATHGFFFPDPKKEKDWADSIQNGAAFKQSDNPLMRCGLLLSGAKYTWDNHPINGVEDGILTSYEVANLYLPNTRLVVLSACETGLGELHGAEGVYGLQRAFKMAGVQYLLMSLWKVPDPETAEFMQLFYKNLLNRKPIAVAFYLTQTTMKHRYPKEPYKWAAWILVK